MFYSDPVCVAAFNAISARLLAGGILFTSHQFDATSSAEFQQLINTRRATFATALLSELLVVGYAAYRLAPDYAPVLIPPTRGPVPAFLRLAFGAC